MQLGPSELILNADNSIYHLNLVPEDIAKTVMVVGDPDRVSRVSQYFDTIEIQKRKREFITHTGTLNGKRLTVISTGIGTDNIDIVLNELDALANIDFNTRTVKPSKTRMDIVRIGTSGAIQPHIAIDSFLLSEYAIGFDNLMHFYESGAIQHPKIQQAFMHHTNWLEHNSTPYVVKADTSLVKKLLSDEVLLGFTATNVGFYGPQGRKLRLQTKDSELNAKLSSFDHATHQYGNGNIRIVCIVQITGA